MPANTFEIVVALCAGIGLAAAAGFRAFLPLLAVSIASRVGAVELNSGLAFLSSDVALIALIVATLAEIGSDKIPIVDHFLDLGSTVLRPAAGFVAAMSMFGDLPEPIAIATALGMSAISLGTQIGRAKTRIGSTATTGGLANPILSTIEDGISFTLSLLAILLPILAGVAVLFGIWLVWKLGRFLRRATRHVEVVRTSRAGGAPPPSMEIRPEP